MVGLLQASLPFLAFNAFVYLLGRVEIVVAILLVTGIALPYAGLVTVGLFAGSLTIFIIPPGVTGFPVLSIAGQFLLKDLGLMAAAVNVIALAKAQPAVVVTDVQAIFAPPVGARASVVMREGVPGRSARRVILAHGTPLPFDKVRAPAPPGYLLTRFGLSAAFSGRRRG